MMARHTRKSQHKRKSGKRMFQSRRKGRTEAAVYGEAIQHKKQNQAMQVAIYKTQIAKRYRIQQQIDSINREKYHNMRLIYQ